MVRNLRRPNFPDQSYLAKTREVIEFYSRGGGAGGKFTGPLKYITHPVLDQIAGIDKDKLQNITVNLKMKNPLAFVQVATAYVQVCLVVLKI